MNSFGVLRPLRSLLTPWWRWWDSNPWPPACRAGALPAELHPQIIGNLLLLRTSIRKLMVGPSGLEPPTSCLSGTRSNLLSYDPMWYSRTWCDKINQHSGTNPEHCVSIELFSRTVSRKVSSPLQSLTSVFGMGTGGPSAFITLTSSISLIEHWILNNINFA